jgi:hypothetical protein
MRGRERARAAGEQYLSGFRVYDLRHTFASLLLAHGAPITYVAAQLGHSKPTTTLQWYAHWIASGHERFVDGLAGPKTLKAKPGATKRGHLIERVGDGSGDRLRSYFERHVYRPHPRACRVVESATKGVY